LEAGGNLPIFSLMLLLALAVAPGLAISIYFLFKDQYNREPRKHLIISFLLGILSAVIAVFLELFFISYFHIQPATSILSAILMAYLVVALVEEWSKYIMVRMYAFPKPEFDEPFDGIVYSVMVSMGFATVENIAYVMEHGYGTAIMRMFLSVPAHASFAIIMGYNLGKAKFAGRRRRLFLLAGLFSATFWHGTYDLFLFLQENHMVRAFISDGLLLGGAIFSFLWAAWLSRIAVREHFALSEQSHRERIGQG
jgi:RsiW-degrading membrane proteinase PrsW (M82 family)